MKLVTFEVPTPLGPVARLGAIGPGGEVVDLNGATAWRFSAEGEPAPARLADALVPPDIVDFLTLGPRAMAEARSTMAAIGGAASLEGVRGPRGETVAHRPGAVRLLSPVPRPPSFRDFYAFEQHVLRAWELRGQPVPPEWYQVPVFYLGNPYEFIGPDCEVPWPAYSSRLDYELELACVIGREGRDIPEDRAMDHVAGFAVLNDFSARDVQRVEGPVRLGPSKAKGFATGLGPWLVTPDEVGDPYDLEMVARVNGEEWSRGRSGTLHWNFAQMIARASAAETLRPGDVIGSGTVGGGCGLELQRWVQPGDVLELEISRLGVLRNRVGARTPEEVRA